VDGVEQSKAMLMEALNNVDGLPREIVALNAGAALYVAGHGETIADGIAQARAALASGAALAKLHAFVALTQGHAERARCTIGD